MFTKIQAKMTKGLNETVETSNPVLMGCVSHGYEKDVEYMWDLLHCSAAKKKWTVFEVDSIFKSRSHSASLFRSLEEFCCFIINDPRLLFYSDPAKQLVSAYFPWKFLDPSECCPPGVTDSTDLNNVQPGRIGNYKIWLMNMASFSHVRVLDSTAPMDITELKQFPVLPLRIVENGENGAFCTVFLPAFLGNAEIALSNSCRAHLLGKLLFGSSYRAGGKYDLVLFGYWFAVPLAMVKQAGMFGRCFVRTCRWFERPNLDADYTCVDAQISISLTACLLNTSTNKFSFTQTPTCGKLNLSSKPNADP